MNPDRPYCQAVARFDPVTFAVAMHIRTGDSLRTFDGSREQIPIPRDGSQLTDDDSERATLRLDESEARALYDALAEFFGHAGASTQALRRDYDAERRRVDRFIDHLTKGTP